MTETRKLPDGSTIKFERIACMVEKPDRVSTGGVETAEAELDRKIKTLMRETKRTYGEAMSVVLNLDGNLKARWVRETLRPRRK